jgi:hypothetical protein
VLNSVFLSVDYDNSCGSSTQTPALDQPRWLGRTLERARAAGESVWLLMHIPPGIDGYDSAESVARCRPPVTFWQPELTIKFLQILREYGPTVQATFLGHTHRFVWADARLDGDTVVVSSPEVARPAAVRYGWADNPPVNLYNKAGLPASPFRTDAPGRPDERRRGATG